MTGKLTDAEIARAVRAGFIRAGADPERYSELVDDIVADVAEALRAFTPEVAPAAPAKANAVIRRAMRRITDAA